MSRLRALVTVMVMSVLLAGCSAAPDPVVMVNPAEAVELMRSVPGIVEVTTRDFDATDEEPITTSVVATAVIAAEANDDLVLAAFDELIAIGTENTWPGAIQLTRENPDAYDPQADVTRPAPWTVEAYPNGARDELAGILALEKIDALVSTAVIDGWPYATLGSIETFATDFRTVVGTPAFAEGGTVSLYSEDHLRIVWIPKRTSLHAIDEIVSIAADYPQAEVLLEATTAGPQWPTLYIARLSAEEAGAIQARLLDPELADADVEGYGLPFILTSIGADGAVYLDGNLGGVVE